MLDKSKEKFKIDFNFFKALSFFELKALIFTKNA